MVDKTKYVSFRVTPREKALIKVCAEQAGMTISDYVRGVVFDESDPGVGVGEPFNRQETRIGPDL
jgi:hypothetical protein